MFSWATAQFEKISEAVAPPPDSGASRFVYCCQRDDEESAIAAAHEIPGVGSIVHTARGQVALHVACASSMPKLIRVLLSMPGASLDVYDAAANTPLHCAATSDKPAALEVVKMLIQEFGCPVATKNAQHKTPYDVASLNSVRQYLLPIQLQQETQHAIDNGGAGLVPGMDMGGLRVSNGHLAPPPTSMPCMSTGGPAPKMYVAPPMGSPSMTAGPPSGGEYHSYHGVPYPQVAPMGYPPVAVAAPMTPAGAPPGSSMFATPTASEPLSQHSLHSTQFSAHSQVTPIMAPPAVSNATPPAPSPNSGGSREYARNGYSSAAMRPKGDQPRRFVRPDGFHSSSSDKNLQQKYGHSTSNLGPAVPPPPSSGGSSVASASRVQSSPASLSGGNNPYSGGLQALGGVNRSASRRYVAVDPITGQQLQPPPAPASGGYGYGLGSSPAPAVNFNMFNPAAQQQPAAVPVPAAAPAPYGYTNGPATMESPAFNANAYAYQQPGVASPAPAGYGFNAPTAAAPASAPYFPPPPMQQQEAAPTFAPPPVAVQPLMQQVPPPDMQPFSQPSPVSADQVFGVRPVEVPTAATPTDATVTSVAPPAAELFSEPHSSSAEYTLGPKPDAPTTEVETKEEPTPAVAPAAPEVTRQPLKRSSTDESGTSAASELFSRPPVQVAVPLVVAEEAVVPPQAEQMTLQRNATDDSGISTASDVFSRRPVAAAAFASPPATITAPPQALDVFAKPVEQSAVDTFATVPPHAHPENGDAAPPVMDDPHTPFDTPATADEGDEDGMTEVPLSPGPIAQQKTPVPVVAEAPTPPPDNSLFSAIGMPPPPFTKKYSS